MLIFAVVYVCTSAIINALWLFIVTLESFGNVSYKRYINTEIQKISRWLKINKLSLNIKKQIILFLKVNKN